MWIGTLRPIAKIEYLVVVLDPRKETLWTLKSYFKPILWQNEAFKILHVKPLSRQLSSTLSDWFNKLYNILFDQWGNSHQCKVSRGRYYDQSSYLKPMLDKMYFVSSLALLVICSDLCDSEINLKLSSLDKHLTYFDLTVSSYLQDAIPIFFDTFHWVDG